jgi:uncharacterized protein YicC (UPF0701 family)
MNKETFKIKSQTLHQNKNIDYSKLENDFELTTVINLNCKIHGFFKLKAGEHLKGKGCSKCAMKMDTIHTSPQAFQNTKKFFVEEIKPTQKISNDLIDILKQSPAFEKQLNNFDYFFYNYNDRNELFKEYYKNNPNAIDTLIKAKQDEGQKLKVVFTERIMKLMKLK